MSKYVIMNEEQRALANDAASKIHEATKGLHPMAVFEALCTHAAMLSVNLNLPEESFIERFKDRRTFIARLTAGAAQNVEA